MKIHTKLYEIADQATPVEVQEFDSKKVEIFSMDDFPGLYDEYTGKQQFTVWSSVDGQNYRLFIESGYHAAVSDLYTKEINSIWLNFWDKCSKISSTFSYKIMLPSTALIIILYFVLGKYVIPEEYNTYFSLGVFVFFLAGAYILNRVTKNKIAKANSDSVDEIKRHLGPKRFEKLIETQRAYMDEFYFKKYPEDKAEAKTEDVDKLEVVSEKEVVDETVKTDDKEKAE